MKLHTFYGLNLYCLYRITSYNVCYTKLLRNDILLAIWDNIEKLKHSENFKSWAAAISKYRAIDYQRRLIKTIKVEPIEGVELQEEDLTDKRVLEKENQEELIKLISKLTPEGQEIFIRRYINEESSKEIARKMDINYELVNNRLSRGRIV